MNRLLLRTGLSLVVVCVAVGTAVGGFGSASEAAPTERVAQADSAAPACEKRDILLLIDQSASLQKSDPDDQRVAGAEALLTGLSSAGVDAKLTVAGFGNTVTDLKPFELPSQQGEALAAIDAFKTQDADRNTDYVLAILAAVKYFEGSPAPPECRTLMWFTDGAYDLEVANPAFVGSYTSLTDPEDIVAGFSAAVCGPVLPPGFEPLGTPLANQIKFDFVVRLIDLRNNLTPATQEKRARTDEVLRNLFNENPDNTCGDIDGARIGVADADEIVAAFFEEALALFDEAQVQAGLTPLDCSVLQAGLPATVVESVAVMAKPTTAPVEIRIGDEVKPTVETGQYSPTTEDRQRAAPLTVAAIGGDLASCFVKASAVIEAIGDPRLYEDAKTTPVYVAVGAPGVAGTPLAGIGEETVALKATLDGAELPIAWDASAHHWVTNIPTPQGAEALLDVSGEFVGPLTGTGLVNPVKIPIQVRDVPSVPQVRWEGTTHLEGTETLGGTLVIMPTADVDATVCVDFGLPTDLVSTEDGSVLGQIAADKTSECGSASEGFELSTRVVVGQSANATGTATIPFSATFQPADEPQARSMGEPGNVVVPEFTLAKPVDSSKQFGLAAILAVASAVLTYLLMLAFTAFQAKLRDPREMLVASTSLVRDPSTNRMGRENSDAPIPLSDLKQVIGSRTKFELGNGVVLRRRLSLNPFGRLSAVVRSDRLVVAAHPGNGSATGDRQRVSVPLRFANMVIVAIDPNGGRSTAMTLVPMGTSPALTVNIIDESLRKLDSQLRSIADGSQVDGRGPEKPTPPSEPWQDPPAPNGGPKGPTPRPAPPTQDSSDPTPSAGSTRRPPPPPHRR